MLNFCIEANCYECEDHQNSKILLLVGVISLIVLGCKGW